MTAKYFGEFLVEKGVIGQEHLVSALIEQIAATPPVCQIVFEKKIMSTDEIFAAFRYQQDNHVEFIEACKALNIWNADIEARALNQLDEIRKPLGHILIEHGAIDLKKLTMMLDEFLSQRTLLSDDKPIKNETISPVVETKIEEQEEEPDFQPGILMELEETFDEKKRKTIKAGLALIKDNAGNDPTTCLKLLQNVYKIVHTLNGLLALLALEKISELLSAIETMLTRLESTISSMPREEIHKEMDVLISAIAISWELRVSIIESATEHKFFKLGDNADRFNQLVKQMLG
jgi:hypothetical protein